MSQISLTSQIKGMATGSVVYRKTAGTGSPEVQTLATLKTDLGLTGTNSGDQTTIIGNAGTATALQTSRDFSISGGGITAAAVGFTGAANVVLSASVDAGHVTLARMADMATASFLGRNTAGTGAPEVLSAATARTILNVANGATAVDLTQPGAIGGTTPGAATFTSLTWTGVTGLSGAIGATIADYFSSTISLDASSTYEISCTAYFLKTTAGTVVFTWAFSSAPTMASSFYTATPITGFTTSTITGAPVVGEAHVQAATTMAHAASGSLSTAVYHVFRFDVTIRTNGATTIKLRATESAGTITPQAGSFMRASKVL